MPGIKKSFNKLFLNRLTRWIARRSHGPFAIVYHAGRHSGRQYKTPIIPYPIDKGFIVALTYGQAVDWFQNVKRVGRCTVLWHGREYFVDKIENIESERALSIYSRFYRFVLKRTHAKDFVKLSYSNHRNPREVLQVILDRTPPML